MLPQTVQMRMRNQFYNYTIINIGEVCIPSGTALDRISWDGMLPGKHRENDPYVKDEWKDPHEIYKWIEGLKPLKGQPKKARLLVTETPINCDVYLESFNAKSTGGYGDINYTIHLMQAKEIKVSTDAAVEDTSKDPAPDPSEAYPRAEGSEPKDPAPDPSEEYPQAKDPAPDPSEAYPRAEPAPTPEPAPILDKSRTEERPAPPAPKTYTVVSGDTLWMIAQKLMGNGGRYTDLYTANMGVIDTRNLISKLAKYTVHPGQVLTIPVKMR
jgi:hypothetical protein